MRAQLALHARAGRRLFFGHSDPDPSSVMYNIDVLGYNIVLKVKYTIYMNVYK